MDNNSTNFNKSNNHLSLQLIELNKKTTTIYNIGNSGSDVGKAQKYGSVKPGNESQILSLCCMFTLERYGPIIVLPLYPLYTD